MNATAVTEAHPRALQKLFGAVAPAYDLVNHTLSLGLDRHWRHALIQSIAPSPAGPILDLAAGTFDLTVALARNYPQNPILAADICLPMLKQGRAKISRVRRKNPATRIVPLNADAHHLPLLDASMASVTLAFGLRNMPPRLPVLRELLRVLRPGGRLGVLEFGSEPRLWGGLYNFYLNRLLPRLGGALSGEPAAYAYLARSIREFPTAETLGNEMRQAGFAHVRHKPLSGGIVYIHRAEKPR